jgi:asparagine synthase (glutamine-hydrolysing)
MCGIAGWVDPQRGQRTPLDVAHAMSEALHHRGPDGTDTWHDRAAGVALVHRRLAVLELTDAGRQPMASSDGRWLLAFNGEVYNHLAMRRALGARAWRGGSDTETLVEAIATWGVERTLQATVGMFAIAAWDCAKRTLVLARDRFGEKPLFWGMPGGTLLFGSELKATWCHPAFDATLDRGAIATMLRHGYVPAPGTMYQAMRKVRPGHAITVRWPNGAPVAEEWAYWRLADVAEAPPVPRDDASALATARHLITDAVALQLVADVPVGAFLSGGVDSSLVVAIAQRLLGQPVRTFTIDFAEPGYSEAEHARVVATHVGTAHEALLVTPEDAREVIPRLPAMYDEPLGDVSQIPTALVAALARRSVTVALSGDGGDELFGGYPRYVREPAVWARMQQVPHALRRLSGRLAMGAFGALPADARGGTRQWRDRFGAYGPLLSADTVDAFFTARLSHWPTPRSIVRGAGALGASFGVGLPPQRRSDMSRMMLLDAHTFMTDDVLVKVDRAAMAVSLETRAPLLDHRVGEFAFSLPDALRVRDGRTKWLLRQLLLEYVPASIVERPKMGFGVPIGQWLRGPLRPWAEALLEPSRLAEQGWLHVPAVRGRWQAHLDGVPGVDNALWTLLSFQAWLGSAPAR